MDLLGILQIAFVVINWVIDWIWIWCGFLFTLIMVKTLLDIVRNVVDTSAPGIRRLIRW